MHYTALLALLGAPLAALAQSTANPFNVPSDGLSASAGQPLTLSWRPTTDGTVTLVLRSGSANDLNEGTVIAAAIDNSGEYTWTPSNALTRGSDYTVEIVDDADPSNVNYTPYFVLDTDTTVAQQTSIVSLGQPTTDPDLSTASPTGAATSLTDVETLVSSTATGALSTATASGMSSPTGTAASTMMSSATNTGASASMSMSMSGSAAASSASESMGASASSDLTSPQQTGNAASRMASGMLGVVGAVAVGALAW